jgi:hypothetical protein
MFNLDKKGDKRSIGANVNIQSIIQLGEEI